MPQSRSKANSAYAKKKKRKIKGILLGACGLLALLLVVFLGRFIFKRSQDPDFRLKDMFVHTTEKRVLPTTPVIIPTTPTLPSVPETEGSSSETESPADPESSEEASSAESSAEASSEESSLETAPPETASAEAPSESSSEETAAESSSEAPSTEAGPSDPAKIEYHLYRSGLSLEELTGTQLVVVESDEVNCKLYFFDKTAEGWVPSTAVPTTNGVVGRNGVISAEEKKEGDGHTPAGYYALGPCYGADKSAFTSMEYHQIVKEQYWIDDPNSQYYNTLWTTAVGPKDWNHAEDLYFLLDVYKYAVFVQYNVDPIVPGKGCAIFLHVETEPKTSGCIATQEATMFAVFSWLKPGADPHILIY